MPVLRWVEAKGIQPVERSLSRTESFNARISGQCHVYKRCPDSVMVDSASLVNNGFEFGYLNLRPTFAFVLGGGCVQFSARSGSERRSRLWSGSQPIGSRPILGLLHVYLSFVYGEDERKIHGFHGVDCILREGSTDKGRGDANTLLSPDPVYRLCNGVYPCGLARTQSGKTRLNGLEYFFLWVQLRQWSCI